MLTLATAEGAAAAATGITAYAWLLIVFPAFGALLLLVGGRRTDRFGPILAVCLSWASFLLGFFIMSRWSAATTPTGPCDVQLYDWLPAGQFQLSRGPAASTRCR